MATITGNLSLSWAAGFELFEFLSLFFGTALPSLSARQASAYPGQPYRRNCQRSVFATTNETNRRVRLLVTDSHAFPRSEAPLGVEAFISF